MTYHYGKLQYLPQVDGLEDVPTNPCWSIYSENILGNGAIVSRYESNA